MSLRGEIDTGIAGDKIKSLFEEHDLQPQDSIAFIAESATFSPQLNLGLMEGSARLEHYNVGPPLVWHQHRYIIPGYRKALILGGDAANGNGVSVAQVPFKAAPAFSRYYVRVKGKWPLVQDGINLVESLCHNNPFGPIAYLFATAGTPASAVSASRPQTLTRQRLPDNVFGSAVDQLTFLSDAFVILNRTIAPTTVADAAIRSIDRLVSFSVDHSNGPFGFGLRHTKGWTTFASVAPSDMRDSDIGGLVTSPDLPGPSFPGASISFTNSDFMFGSSGSENPSSLINAGAPMIQPSLGNPQDVICLECMFVGSVPESAMRPEEYIELKEPVIVS